MTPEFKAIAENRGDCCPECIAKNATLPHEHAIDEGTDTLTCWYACAACGHRWFTNWWLTGLIAA